MLTQASRLEHEEKYLLPASRSQTALGLLRQGLVVDPDHPRGRVYSVYFDTPDWKHLGEKVNGDRHKSKLRVRWYGQIGGDGLSGGGFVEVKVRVGSARSKLRLPATPSATLLAKTPLSDPIFSDLRTLLGELGVPASGTLRPVFEIAYDRYRFVDPIHRDRVSLDTNISITRTNPLACYARTGVSLPNAVVEVKGPGGRLPRILERDRRLSLRRSSFSKYEACCAANVRCTPLV